MKKLFLFLSAISFMIGFSTSVVSADTTRAKQAKQITKEARVLVPSAAQDGPGLPQYPVLDELAEHYDIERDVSKEAVAHELLETVYSEYTATWQSVAENAYAYDALIFFVAYDYGTTASLGAGERAGVINSWRSSQRTLAEGVYIPTLTGHWKDILKIANGRWPAVLRHPLSESAAANIFQTIYLRPLDPSESHDAAAVITIAYGLRPQPRSLEREKTAIGFFDGIYKHPPSSAQDWDIVRAIAYSGAVR